MKLSKKKKQKHVLFTTLFRLCLCQFFFGNKRNKKTKNLTFSFLLFFFGFLKQKKKQRTEKKMEYATLFMIFSVFVICVFIATLLWNINLIRRTMASSDQYMSAVLTCIDDGMKADSNGDPSQAAVETKQAISNLDYTSLFAGGDENLTKITQIDINKLRALLKEQHFYIQQVLARNKNKQTAYANL